MKQHLAFSLIVFGCMALSTGCAAQKATHERGWMGGKYLESTSSFFKKMNNNYFETDNGVIPSLPEEIKKRQSSAVFVFRVYDGTPAKKAGLQEGDLIIAADGQKVENVKRLRKIVDQSEPGKTLMMSICRDRELKDLPVVVGRETYQEWGYFSIGFKMGTQIDLAPDPDFDLLGLVSFKTTATRLELNSPEYRYFRDSMTLPPDKSDRTPESEADMEGWAAWFGIFGLSGKKIILNQEI